MVSLVRSIGDHEQLQVTREIPFVFAQLHTGQYQTIGCQHRVGFALQFSSDLTITVIDQGDGVAFHAEAQTMPPPIIDANTETDETLFGWIAFCVLIEEGYFGAHHQDENFFTFGGVDGEERHSAQATCGFQHGQ
jgi:hypothetical protein